MVGYTRMQVQVDDLISNVLNYDRKIQCVDGQSDERGDKFEGRVES